MFSTEIDLVQEYDDFMWDQYDTPDAERKKVERINVGFWANKVWYDDEKITKETIQKSFKRCGIKAPALRAQIIKSASKNICYQLQSNLD